MIANVRETIAIVRTLEASPELGSKSFFVGKSKPGEKELGVETEHVPSRSPVLGRGLCG